MGLVADCLVEHTGVTFNCSLELPNKFYESDKLSEGSSNIIGGEKLLKFGHLRCATALNVCPRRALKCLIVHLLTLTLFYGASARVLRT